MPGRHQLTELQLAILRVLWDRSEATVQEIWEALHAERGLAQTTVATMLSRLERRGVVTRRAPPPVPPVPLPRRGDRTRGAALDGRRADRAPVRRRRHRSGSASAHWRRREPR